MSRAPSMNSAKSGESGIWSSTKKWLEEYEKKTGLLAQEPPAVPIHYSSEQLCIDEAKAFAQRHDLDAAVMQTGALIATKPKIWHEDGLEKLAEGHPEIYDSMYMPTDEDKEALEDEQENPWHHKKQIPRTIILCSVGAAVQGWDETGSNGANISFPQDLGLHQSLPGRYPGHDDWVIGLINAAPYISAGLLGCWISDPVNYYVGRRGATFVSAVLLTLPIIGSSFSQNWWELMFCRLLMGIGMGIKASTIPIYMAENSPKSIRGALTMTWQMFVSLGILLGFAANLCVADVKAVAAWRLQFGSAFIPALPLLFGIYFCPESPRWLYKKNRVKKAFESFQRLRNTNLQAARDLFYMHKELTGTLHQSSIDQPVFNYQQTAFDIRSYFVRLKELFTKNRVRQATLAAFVVMLAQQMCGINIIAFYSSTLFKTAASIPKDESDALDTSKNKQALLLSFGFGCMNFFFAIPALFTIDRWGRRTLLIITFPQLAWTLLAAGLCTLIHPHDPSSSVRLGLVTFFIFLYTAIYSTGEGPVPFTYSAEVFPLSHRELGMGLSVSINLTFAAILSLTFPPMLAKFEPVGAICFYAGLNVLAFIMIYLLMPETTKRTLEQLDVVFEKPVKTFAKESLRDIGKMRRYDDLDETGEVKEMGQTQSASQHVEEVKRE